MKKKEAENLNSGLIIGYDFTKGKDVGVLIVGAQVDKQVKIVNAFQGEEAWELYQRLITVKKGEAK